MKTLLLLLICALLPISASAGVKFETYNGDHISWEIDTTCITTGMVIADSILSYSRNQPATDFDAWFTAEVAPQNHDTLREYIVGLDTIIILHRVECDTNFTKFFVENDSTFVQIEGITCDTIFRVDFRDVWAPKVMLYLDSLLWQKLLKILEE